MNTKTSDDEKVSSSGLLFRAIVYLIINAAQPLLMDLMKYHGAASPSTFVYVIPTYLGMVLVGLLPKKKHVKSIWKEDWNKAFYLTICDMMHQLLEKAGLVYAGSAVYMLLSSSATVWTAVFAFIVLKQRLSLWKWFGIITICVGLSLKAFQVTFSAGENEILGAVLTIVAAILHALTYVLNEFFMTGTNSIEGSNLTCMNGIISSSILGLWTIFWTIPQWKVLLVDNIQEKNGDPLIAAGCFALLLLCAFLRSATLWYLIKYLGAVKIGVLKGIRTPTVFVLSHIFYCHIQSTQCLTPLKGLAVVVCTAGVITFTLAENVMKKETESAASTPVENVKTRLLPAAEGGKNDV